MRCSGVDCRDISTAMVDAASAARMKKCHGLKPASVVSAFSRTDCSVEVAELIFEPLTEDRIVDGLWLLRCGGFLVAPRPPERDDCDERRPARPGEIRQEPRETV